MTRLSIVLTLFILASSTTYARLAESIYFETASSSIPPSELPKLEEVARIVEEGYFDVVILIGNADERGDLDYNYDLAQRRAQAVEEVLAGLGVSKNVKISVSQGEEEPLSDVLADNRRVDVYLFAKKEVDRQDNNMLILHLGIMPHGVKALETSPHRAKVGQKMEPGLGLTYMRRVYKCLNVGGTVMNNPTFTINLGCSW